MKRLLPSTKDFLVMKWYGTVTVSRASGAGLCGVGSITLSGEKGSV